RGPFFLGSYSIQPVIARHEIPPGPANDGHLQLTYFRNHIVSESLRIRQLGSRLVYALVDRAPQLFQERAEQLLAYRSNLPVGVDHHPSGRALRRAHPAGNRSRRHDQACLRSAFQELSSGNLSHAKPSVTRAPPQATSLLRAPRVG